MPSIKRSQKNPILWPNRENDWEAEATFNGCVLNDTDKVHMVYRAESVVQRIEDIERSVSIIGYSVSSDGTRFTKRRPLITPEEDWERFGCEDPRITKFEGKYYIFYTALSTYPFGPNGIRTGVAITRDFKKLEKHPVTTFNAKAMALFPGRVNGKIAAILTANTDQPPSKIGIALFDKEEDMWSANYWDSWYSNLDEHTIPLQRNDNDHVELGAPPILTKRGWLVIYSYIRNYRHGQKLFGVEAVLLDKDDPRKIISRTERPFLIPEEEYELYGRVPNIVFPSGAFIKKDLLHIYYGAADMTCCLATCNLNELLDEMTASSVKLVRFNGNPIIEPNRDHAWEAKATFNPAAIEVNGTFHIFYRTLSDDDTSMIGYASSTDGLHIEKRLSDPVYVPREDFEKKARENVGSGCEDPRLTIIGDTVYMCYTAYNGVDLPRIALTSILLKDLVANRWKWSKPTLISPPHVDDKDAAIFPKKIHGKYAILHRIGMSVWIDFVKDLKKFQSEKWVEGRVLMKPRAGTWDSRKIGIGAPPIETKDGWLLLYHGISKSDVGQYDVRVALLDKKDPTRVLARTKYPIFEPEMAYERDGIVPNVVFPCGAVLKHDELYVYYGGADKVVGVATIKVSKLLELLKPKKVSKITPKKTVKKYARK